MILKITKMSLTFHEQTEEDVCDECCKTCEQTDIEICYDCGECADPSLPNRCCECEEEEELKCLGFRPQSRIGECEGCKAVCEECENLMIMEEEEEEEYQWWGHTYTDERGNTISFFNATEKWIEENAEYKYNEYGKLDCFKDMR